LGVESKALAVADTDGGMRLSVATVAFAAELKCGELARVCYKKVILRCFVVLRFLEALLCKR
jgi:hypothetical protein